MLTVTLFCLLLGLIPALVARSKGHDFLIYWVIGAVLFPFVVAYCVFMPRSGQADRPGTALKSAALGVVLFVAWVAVLRMIAPPLSL